MKIAVIGSGGREHAILWRLARDSERHALYALPGNGGTHALAQSIDVNVTDTHALHAALCKLRPDLVVVGPEGPLAAGITDMLDADKIPCFGPTARAARIESSKVFAKRLMQRHGIPTAEFEVFDDFEKLARFVASQPAKDHWVVKADGLAAGKGAFVCSSQEEVLRYADDLLRKGKLGAAGKTVVLERRLSGREASALFWCDGQHAVALPPAQDYKRAFDNDEGSNTGGMGAFCPAQHLTQSLLEKVHTQIVQPTLRALADEGSPYRGILYVGLMLTEQGPQVIEFNCRFGDPETQVILPLWRGSCVDMMVACVESRLSAQPPNVATDGCAVCVVLAAEGYPDSYARSIPLHTIPDNEFQITFHAGTGRDGNRIISTGGRVLNAVGRGATLAEARNNAYDLAQRLLVPGLRMRTDIALMN